MQDFLGRFFPQGDGQTFVFHTSERGTFVADPGVKQVAEKRFGKFDAFLSKSKVATVPLKKVMQLHGKNSQG
jgi:hypothetical protein